MTVTVQSSSYQADHQQADGRAWVTETVRLSNGINVARAYLSGVGADRDAHLTALVAIVLTDLANAEIASNIAAVSYLGSLAAPTLIYSTAAQNIAALREAYRSASRDVAIMMGDYLNSLTDTQLQSAFGLTQAQVTSLRTNYLAPAATAAASIRSAAGQ